MKTSGVKLSVPLPQIEKLTSTLPSGADFKRYQLTSYNTNENFFVIQFLTRQPEPNVPHQRTDFSVSPTAGHHLHGAELSAAERRLEAVQCPTNWERPFSTPRRISTVLPGFPATRILPRMPRYSRRHARIMSPCRLGADRHADPLQGLVGETPRRRPVGGWPADQQRAIRHGRRRAACAVTPTARPTATPAGA